MNRFLGRYNDESLLPKEDPIDYKALEQADPQVVSLTFFRNPREIPARRLGVRLEQTEDDGGDVRVAELALSEDSILHPTMPIQVGDILVAVNNQSCYGKTFDTLKQEALAKTGLITLHLRKTDAAPIQDEIRQAIFIEPKAHTCLPMAIDLQKDGTLTIASIDPFNDWLTSSCLARGQAVLTMNGASSYQLEEEDAQLFLQTKNELNPYLSIKTYAPSRAGAVKTHVVHDERELSVGLTCYIAHEEQNMNKQLMEAIDDKTVDKMGDFIVFVTSTKLFVYIKGSITRCASITKGKAFYLLCQAFENALQDYARVLASKLPPPLPQSSVLGRLSLRKRFSKQSSDEEDLPAYSVPRDEEGTICQVLSTCEYCADRIEALQHIIRENIDDEYKLRINLTETQELFHEITVNSVYILVSGLENRLEPCFKKMRSVNWAKFEVVTSESGYVLDMYNEIPPYLAVTRQLLPTSYFRSVCDKFAMAFTDTYYNTLVAIKHVSEAGIQQLLLDVYNLKTLFLKLPVLAKSIKTAHTSKSMEVPAMYTEIVEFQFNKIQTLLKLGHTHANLGIVHDEIVYSQVFKDLPGFASVLSKSRKSQTFEDESAEEATPTKEEKTDKESMPPIGSVVQEATEDNQDPNGAEDWRNRSLADQI